MFPSGEIWQKALCCKVLKLMESEDFQLKGHFCSLETGLHEVLRVDFGQLGEVFAIGRLFLWHLPQNFCIPTTVPPSISETCAIKVNLSRDFKDAVCLVFF